MTNDAGSDNARIMTLYKVSALCESQLTQLFAQLLDRSDAAFFTLAQKATPKETQLFFETMRMIRLQRETLEAEFRRQLHLILGRMPAPGGAIGARRNADMELMRDEDLKENIAFDAMIKRALVQYEHQLHHVVSWYQYAYGSFDIQIEWLPMHPQQLGTAVRKALRGLQLNARLMNVMFQLFEREVLANVGAVLQSVTELFSQAEAVSVVVEKPAQELPPEIQQLTDAQQQQINAYLDELVAAARRAALHTPPRISNEQLVNGLVKLQATAVKLDDDSVQVLDVRGLLAGQLAADRDSLGLLNSEMIRLVNDMFAHILGASSLAEEFRVPIARLQIPMLKIAIQNRELFTERHHPARQLLNEMAHSGLGFDPRRRGNDVVLQQVHFVVSQILATPNPDSQQFEQWLADFQLCVREEFRRSLIIERRMREAEEGKARSEDARRAAEQVLVPLLHGREVAPDMVQFLDDIWRMLLQLEHVRSHGVTETFRRYQVTADLLLQSVDARATDDAHSRAQRNEKVRHDLRDGFTAMGLAPAEIAQWLQRIEAEHTRLLECAAQQMLTPIAPQAPPAAATVIAQSSVDALQPIARDDNRTAESTGDSRQSVEPNINASRFEIAVEQRQVTPEFAAQTDYFAPTSSIAPAPVQVEITEHDIILHEENANGIHELIWQQVDSLPVPCWVLTRAADGAALRCKLAAKIASLGRYIFVNRTGVKVLEMQREAVARAFADASMSLVDDCALFDRALLDVIQNLRRLKAQEDAPVI